MISIDNFGERSCNSADGTDQRVQSLMFMMMFMMTMISVDSAKVLLKNNPETN
jgi:hypothetical protein